MNGPRALVLASTSPARRMLMDRLQVPYEALSPAVDEDALRGATAEETAELRARAKARAGLALRPDAAILGADQVLDLEGELLGKPGSIEGAKAQLRKLSGRSHRLVTAVVLIDQERVQTATSIDTLSVRPLDDAEIGRYVESDRPESCAGSYKIESLGITLFDGVVSSDWTSVVGLPLLHVCSMLRNAGWLLP